MARSKDFDVTKMNPKDSKIHKEQIDKDHSGSNEIEFHPSFGKIAISSFSGGGSTFFGSDIEHSGGVNLKIGMAQRKRGLSTDWTYCYDDIVSIKLSHLQWAELISMGMGKGDGTPCTINYRHDMGYIVGADNQDKKELFKKDMSKTLGTAQKMGGDIQNEMIKMLEGKTIKKADLKELVSKMNILRNNIGGNIDFVKDSFVKEMNIVENEAQQNIQGYLKHTAQNLGVEALVNKSNLLGSGEKK